MNIKKKIIRMKMKTVILYLLVGVFVVMAFSVLELRMIQPAQAQSLTIEKTWGGTKDDFWAGVLPSTTLEAYM